MSSESERKGPELPASWEAIVRRIAREVAVEVVESAFAEKLGYVPDLDKETPEGASPLPVCGGPGSDASRQAVVRRSSAPSSSGVGCPARPRSTPAAGPEEAGNSSSATVCTCCCICPRGRHGMPDLARARVMCNVHGWPQLRKCPVHFVKPEDKDSTITIRLSEPRSPEDVFRSPPRFSSEQRETATGALSEEDEPTRIANAYAFGANRPLCAAEVRTYGDDRVRVDRSLREPEPEDFADYGPPEEAAPPAMQERATLAPQQETPTGALSEDSEEFRLASMYFAEFHDQHAAIANDIRSYGDARVREATAKLIEAAEAMVMASLSDWPTRRAEFQDEIKKASGG